MTLSKVALVEAILTKLGYSLEELSAFHVACQEMEEEEKWLAKQYEWPVIFREAMQAQYNVNPPENKTYKFVMQFHYRGKSRHIDFRCKINDHLVGWTLNEQVAGALKEPIENMSQAKKDTGAWRKTSKINNEPGMGNVKLLTETKAPEPVEWLTFEGVVPEGEVGATKEYRGVFSILDSGTVEFGAQKSRFHEYFLHGKKFDGRWLVRQLPVRGLKPQEGKAPLKGNFVWFTWKAKDDTPYTISKSAVDDRWVPPLGVSALPKAIRNRIPSKFRYWKKTSQNERLKVRDALVEALKKKEVKLSDDLDASLSNMEKLTHVASQLLQVKTVPFVLQRHWFRGQVVVRRGPSREFWDLRFNMPGEKGLRHYVLSDNPVEAEETSAALQPNSDAAWLNPEKFLPKDSEAGGLFIPPKDSPEARKVRIKGIEQENPSKNTPSFLDEVAKGKATFLIDKDDLKRIRFESKKFKGLFTLEREEQGGLLFMLKRARLPQPKTDMQTSEAFSLTESVEARFLTGVALREGEIKGVFYDGTEIKKAMPTLIGKQIRMQHANEGYDNVGFITNSWYSEEEKAGHFEGYVIEKFAIQRLDDGRLNFVSPGFAFALETVKVEKPDGQEGILERKTASEIRFEELSLLENPASLYHRVLSKEVRMLEAFKLSESYPLPEGVDVLKIDARDLAFVVIAKTGEPYPPQKVGPLPERQSGASISVEYFERELVAMQEYPLPTSKGVLKVSADALQSVIVVRKGLESGYPLPAKSSSNTFPEDRKKDGMKIEGKEISKVVLMPKRSGEKYPMPVEASRADYPLPGKAALKIRGSELAWLFLAPKGFKGQLTSPTCYPLPNREKENQTMKGERLSIVVPLLESNCTFDDEKLEMSVTIVKPGLSLNGNEYTKGCLGSGFHMFEGLKCYDNHVVKQPQHGRSTKEQVGFYKDVFADDEGVHAVLKVFPSEKWAYERMKAQVQNPKAKICGVSIDAIGRGREVMSGGKKVRVIEEFVRVSSADLVGEPSAGGSINRVIEGKEEESDMLTAEQIKKDHPELLEEIKTEAMQAMTPEMKKLEEEIKKLKEENAKLIEENKKMKEAQAKAALQAKIDEKIKKTEEKMELKESTKKRLVSRMLDLGNEKTAEGAERSNWDLAIDDEIAYLKEAAGVDSKKKDEERGSEVIDSDRIDTKTKTTPSKEKLNEDRLLEGVLGGFSG
jgi:hypothetical protein